MSYLDRVRPRNLILASRWSCYTEGYNEIEMEIHPEKKKWSPMVVDTPGTIPNAQESAKAFSRRIDKLANLCEQLGVKLWIIKQVPETGDGYVARQFCMHSLHPQLCEAPDETRSIRDHQRRQRFTEAVLGKIQSDHVTVLEPSRVCFGSDGNTVNYRQGRACYRDDDYLTRWGRNRSAGSFMP